MGFYLVRDAFKTQWVQYTFGEEDTKHLYTCDKTYGTSKFFNCKNDDDDIADDPDWNKFIKKLEAAKDRRDLEKFFHTYTYIKWQVSRYLFGSWDHKTSTHNNAVYMTKMANNKIYIPLLYDFDMDFGSYKVTNPWKNFYEEVVDPENPLYTLLDLNDESEEVREMMDEIMRKAFNPNIVLPRIDQLKAFIDPYVKEDRTKGANGRKPGRMSRMNIKVEDYYEYEDFVKNCEFTSLKAKQYSEDGMISSATVIGLKVWAIERFKHACTTYNLDCSYADEILSKPEYAKYDVDTVTREIHGEGCRGSSYSCCVFDSTPVILVDDTGEWGMEGEKWCLMNKTYEIKNEDCWSLKQGYPCCARRETTVSFTDKNNGEEWGFEKNDWCGITDLQRCPMYNKDYKCCKGCTVKYTDNYKWGVENGIWCSIPYSCDKK